MYGLTLLGTKWHVLKGEVAVCREGLVIWFKQDEKPEELCEFCRRRMAHEVLVVGEDNGDDGAKGLLAEGCGKKGKLA